MHESGTCCYKRRNVRNVTAEHMNMYDISTFNITLQFAEVSTQRDCHTSFCENYPRHRGPFDVHASLLYANCALMEFDPHSSGEREIEGDRERECNTSLFRKLGESRRHEFNLSLDDVVLNPFSIPLCHNVSNKSNYKSRLSLFFIRDLPQMRSIMKYYV